MDNAVYQTTIVRQYVGPHPCILPDEAEREAREIGLWDVVECNVCHQQWALALDSVQGYHWMRMVKPVEQQECSL